MSNAPSIVYHYCSLDSFFAIINHSTIRLSNIAKSNDREEVRHCFDIFEKTLRDSCLEFSKYYGCRKFFDNIDYNDLVSRAVTNDSLIYYVSCFSAESDLLSQWRGYADDGRGVAKRARSFRWRAQVSDSTARTGRLSRRLSPIPKSPPSTPFTRTATATLLRPKSWNMARAIRWWRFPLPTATR